MAQVSITVNASSLAASAIRFDKEDTIGCIKGTSEGGNYMDTSDGSDVIAVVVKASDSDDPLFDLPTLPIHTSGSSRRVTYCEHITVFSMCPSARTCFARMFVVKSKTAVANCDIMVNVLERASITGL
jgi:hypothetical protein